MKSLSCVQLFATPWTIAHQASQTIGFSRQEYWSRLPFPSPRDLTDPGIEPGSSALQADSLPKGPYSQSYGFSNDFPGGSDGKASAYNAGDPGSIPGLGRSIKTGVLNIYLSSHISLFCRTDA